jgi:hypothetical protein
MLGLAKKCSSEKLKKNITTNYVIAIESENCLRAILLNVL